MTIATYPPQAIAPSSTTLGYAEVTANQTGLVYTADLTGLAVTVFIPAGRRIRVTGHVGQFNRSAGTATWAQLKVREGVVQLASKTDVINNNFVGVDVAAILLPTAGVHTYKLTSNGDGTMDMIASADMPAYILVEDITGGTGGPGPIQLAYAEVTAQQTGITTEVDITGLSVTVNVPAGRRIRIRAEVAMNRSVADGLTRVRIKEGSTVLQLRDTPAPYGSSGANPVSMDYVTTPAAGVHTYKLSIERVTGTGTTATVADPTFPAFILVEDITGTPSPAGILPTSQTLGYAQVTATQGTFTAETDLTGVSVTVTVPDGRRLRITGMAMLQSSVSGDVGGLVIQEDGVQVAKGAAALTPVNWAVSVGGAFAVRTPSAGTHTYKLRSRRDTGTGNITMYSDATNPAYILVEDITGGAPAVPPVNVPVGQLAYAQVATGQTIGATSTETAITGLSVNVVVPAGRTLRITGHSGFQAGVAGDRVVGYIKEGSTYVGRYGQEDAQQNGAYMIFDGATVISPSAGAHTYFLTAQRYGGTGSLLTDNAGDRMGFILVEDITPTPAPASTAPSSTLAYNQVVANQAGITTQTALTGLSVTVTVSEGRRLRITGEAYFQNSSVNVAAGARMFIKEDGTQLQQNDQRLTAANIPEKFTSAAVISPSAGTHTYSLTADNGGGGTAQMVAGAGYPAFILVEDITGVGVAVHDHAVAPSSTLGYAEVTANQTGITTPAVDLTGLSVTVTVPAGRRLRITGQARSWMSTVNDDRAVFAIQEGATGLNQTVLATDPAAGNSGNGAPVIAIVSPSAGSHTYKLTAASADVGSLTMVAAATYPAFILVEDITGVGVAGHTHSELDDTGWIALPLSNSWVSYDNTYGPPQYRKKAGVVYVQGLIKNGTLSATMATLPAGFRPAATPPTLLFTVQGAAGLQRIDVQQDGRITGAPGNAGWTSLAGIIFPADQ